jgi:hypothetical protein
MNDTSNAGDSGNPAGEGLFPPCTDSALTLAAAIVGFILFIISEALGIKNGTGTCSSIIQYALSTFNYLKGLVSNPVVNTVITDVEDMLVKVETPAVTTKAAWKAT